MIIQVLRSFRYPMLWPRTGRSIESEGKSKRRTQTRGSKVSVHHTIDYGDDVIAVTSSRPD